MTNSIISKRLSNLSLRERFSRTMHFQYVDKIPNFEFGYWDETLPTWHKQGLPTYVDNEAKAYEYFGIENYYSVPINFELDPSFEYTVLSENNNHLIIIDNEGVKCEIRKDGKSTIPHYLEYPIKNKADWESFKERLIPDIQKRYPPNWPELVNEYNNRDYPLGIYCGSIVGKIRDWMGFENFALALYDMPDLIDEMVEYLTEFTITLMEKALMDIEFDFAGGWEDIAFNNGPIISPTMFKEILLPRYKRIAKVLNKHGVDIIWTDCDGDIKPIVEMWLEAGYKCMFPVEVHAGTDPVLLRKMYGDRILFMGGVNKMKLKGTKQEILEELKRLEPIINEGGFIPHIDHRCPPDVPLENYIYYLENKKALLGF
ncbi:uroporphyrinogen decarboxylase family protein [Caldicellulosiruptoraceae bacterium PP1]